MNITQRRLFWPWLLFAAVVAATSLATGTQLYPWFWAAWAFVLGTGIATIIGMRKAGKV